MMQEKYPCDICTRVRDTERCDNKECAMWRRWFLKRWQQTCRLWQQDGCPKAEKRKLL